MAGCGESDESQPASNFSLSLADLCIWLQLRSVDGQSRGKFSTNLLRYVALNYIFMNILGERDNTSVSGHLHPNTFIVK